MTSDTSHYTPRPSRANLDEEAETMALLTEELQWAIIVDADKDEDQLIDNQILDRYVLHR